MPTTMPRMWKTVDMEEEMHDQDQGETSSRDGSEESKGNAQEGRRNGPWFQEESSISNDGRRNSAACEEKLRKSFVRSMPQRWKGVMRMRLMIYK
jgi:hypothetical protein